MPGLSPYAPPGCGCDLASPWRPRCQMVASSQLVWGARRHTSEWSPGWFKYARAQISQACQWPPDLLQNRSGTRPLPLLQIIWTWRSTNGLLSSITPSLALGDASMSHLYGLPIWRDCVIVNCSFNRGWAEASLLPIDRQTSYRTLNSGQPLTEESCLAFLPPPECRVAALKR